MKFTFFSFYFITPKKKHKIIINSQFSYKENFNSKQNKKRTAYIISIMKVKLAKS